jgi:hypothetical protein
VFGFRLVFAWFSQKNPGLFQLFLNSCSSDRKCACIYTCPPGKFQDDEGQTACKSCTAGFYQNVAGKSECHVCSTNTYSLPGSSSCDFTSTTCPLGTYASGTAACTLCEVGKYNDLTGQTACKTCLGNIDANRTECTQKKMCKEATSEQCSKIGDGWTSITSIAECGRAVERLGWREEVGSSHGSQFPPGCFSRDSDRVRKSSFNTLTTSTESCDSYHACACTLRCPPGKFQNEADKTTCKSCPIGYFQPTTGRGDCNSCETGKTSPTQAVICYDAANCPQGTYASGTDTLCDSCGTESTAAKLRRLTNLLVFVV